MKNEKERKMANRFDYVKYDKMAEDQQAAAKFACQALEAIIDKLNSPRAKALALTNLEQTYMWVGKAVRDDQLIRNNGTAELQEGRNNG